MKTLINARIYDHENYIENGYVTFDKTIQSVGPMKDFVANDETIIDVNGDLLIPSFVTMHTHVYSTFARGLSLPFKPDDFLDILKQMWWKIDAHLTRDMIYHSAIVSAAEHALHGVTTMFDHHASKNTEGSLDMLKKGIVDTVGLRGAFCFETSDRFNVDECIDENLHGIKTFNDTSSQAYFGLHASLTLSDDTLGKVASVFDENPIHIHVAESEMDQTDAKVKSGMRAVERLEKHGLIRPGSLIVHGLYLDDVELDILKKRDAVVVLNPSSNMNNGVGLPLGTILKRKGIRMVLGNDGLSPSVADGFKTLHEAMHLKDKSPNHFNLDDIQNMIKTSYTVTNEAFSINTGKISEGYEADLLTIPYSPPTPMNRDNAFAHLYYGLFHAFKPNRVFAGGRQIVRDYKLVDNLQKKVLNAQKSAQSLWDGIGKEET